MAAGMDWDNFGINRDKPGGGVPPSGGVQTGGARAITSAERTLTRPGDCHHCSSLESREIMNLSFEEGKHGHHP